jgi:hypothetical protein
MRFGVGGMRLRATSLAERLRPRQGRLQARESLRTPHGSRGPASHALPGDGCRSGTLCAMRELQERRVRHVGVSTSPSLFRRGRRTSASTGNQSSTTIYRRQSPCLDQARALDYSSSPTARSPAAASRLDATLRRDGRGAYGKTAAQSRCAARPAVKVAATSRKARRGTPPRQPRRLRLRAYNEEMAASPLRGSMLRACSWHRGSASCPRGRTMRSRTCGGEVWALDDHRGDGPLVVG